MDGYWWLIILCIVVIILIKVKFLKWYSKHQKKEDKNEEND